MRHLLLTVVFVLISYVGFAQKGVLKGNISDEGQPVSFASILVTGTDKKAGTSADRGGDYSLYLNPGTYEVTFSAVGYRIAKRNVIIKSGETSTLNVNLSEDMLGLDQVVVTGSRSEVPSYNAPVVVNRITSKTLEMTQSLSLSEGLNFSPGLRMETNCQNCGFNQLRINGLEGAYSQILINSRPVFSALAGVYGLEMIPANMVNRIEVVKGGGSALYGGNAIGGTVNIITNDPSENMFQVGTNLSFIKGKTPDRTIFVNGSVVSDALDKGMSFFAYNRDRKPFDANGDDFSEITKLKNNTFGADFFWNTSDRSKLKANFNSISEFRRGGNKFDLQPHESDITEQLRHRILGGDISFEIASDDRDHQFTFYTSAQNTERNSYYGGGGQVINSEDAFNTLSGDEKEGYIIALNSYGKSNDLSSAAGVQYIYNINNDANLSLGTEYQYNHVEDNMPGYSRTIDQKVGTFGNYAQLEWTVSDLTLLLGARYDLSKLDGNYNFAKVSQPVDRKFSNFVPRVTLKYDISEHWKLRGSFAQGYRIPQAFDEDLHVASVGGETLFAQLSPNLEPEKSNNITGSINYVESMGNWQANIVAEGFLTRLNNAFVFRRNADGSEWEDTNKLVGVTVKEKVNAEGATTVKGLNFEANLAYLDKFVFQLGLTAQMSEYEKPQFLFEEENTNKKVYTDRILRSPDTYGFFAATYRPSDAWSFNYSGVLTGSMRVFHEGINKLVETPTFFENNIKGSYKFETSDHYFVELSAGLQNIFNSYQSDFDKGADRDSTYIYGPVRPRTVFVGLKFGLD